MACILLWSSAVRVHDSQTYRKMDVSIDCQVIKYCIPVTPPRTYISSRCVIRRQLILGCWRWLKYSVVVCSCCFGFDFFFLSCAGNLTWITMTVIISLSVCLSVSPVRARELKRTGKKWKMNSQIKTKNEKKDTQQLRKASQTDKKRRRIHILYLFCRSDICVISL